MALVFVLSCLVFLVGGCVSCIWISGDRMDAGIYEQKKSIGAFGLDINTSLIDWRNPQAISYCIHGKHVAFDEGAFIGRP